MDSKEDVADSATREPVDHKSDRKHTQEKPTNAFRELLSIVGVLASALVLAFILISFVFQSYQVDGPSMQPTLETGDHLIIWKVPRTFAKVTGNQYVPKRGDVIVLNNPNRQVSEPPQLIKRVVGLPGDRIVIKDGEVMVYNQEHPDGYNPDESLPYGTVIDKTPDDEDVTLTGSQLYVIGDHRDNSKDSREFGPVSTELVIGKLIVRILPLSQFTRF